jgi:hypothetical protein
MTAPGAKRKCRSRDAGPLTADDRTQRGRRRSSQVDPIRTPDDLAPEERLPRLIMYDRLWRVLA